MIASATDFLDTGLNRNIIIQMIAAVIGIALALIILLVDYNTYGEMYKIIYVLSLVAMLTVYIPGLGVVQFGARSWIDLKVMYFQPAEIGKLGFIISFAKFLEHRYKNIDSLKDIMQIGLFIMPFMLLLLKQPDLGTALVFLFIACGMVFVAQIDRKFVLGGLGSLVVAMPLAYKFMKPHQRIRIDAFLNPEDISLPGNYHVMQSKITIGSGRLFGKGLFEGVYHRYNYLPVRESDFIFAVLGEELGFVGGIVVLVLYYVFLTKMLKVVGKSKDIYGKLVATGVVFMFAFQIIENIGMTMGVMPVTGVTLPFFSYGGSSVMTSMMAVGLISNVYMRRKRKSFNM
jgi:rod shape determining protein RodA